MIIIIFLHDNNSGRKGRGGKKKRMERGKKTDDKVRTKGIKKE